MKKRIAITGGTGFVGQYMSRALLERGDDVWVGANVDPPAWLLTPAEQGALHRVHLDVRADADLAALLDQARPDLVVHLAGISFPPDAERDPRLTHDVNVGGAVRLMTLIAERRRAGTLDPVVLAVGSGTQYGKHDPAENPLPETAACHPVGAYATTKQEQEERVLALARETGVRALCTRSFNHSGRGQAPEFLLPSLVRRARALPATGGALAMGNDVVRDYLHVSDVVDAYLALGERGRSGEVYNVASGVGVGVRALAALVLERAGVRAEIVADPALQRTGDTPVLVGSVVKLQRDTGWAPRRSLADLVDDLIERQQEG